MCHHVTGDCLRCEVAGNIQILLSTISIQDGRYGAGCRGSCSCDTNGTALCSHLDGRCFCEGNYFGERCDLFCPFGFDQNLGCLQQLEVGTITLSSVLQQKMLPAELELPLPLRPVDL